MDCGLGEFYEIVINEYGWQWGGEGTNLLVPIPDILRMSPSPSPSELLERISIPSSNNNRGSPRVPDPRIINTHIR